MRSGFAGLTIILLTIVLYVSSCRNAGRWLEKKDNPVHCDAMVILMGSIADRVLEAVDHYNQGKADRVIIVDESMGSYRLLEARGVNVIRNTTQVNDILTKLGIPADSISVLPGDATSTQMEAMILRDYLADKPSVDTIMIISSAYHTRRASMIFNYAFRDAETPVRFIFSPSRYTYFNNGKWWKSKEDIQIVVSEYVKIANFLFVERRKI